jgi:hypothetical protein
MKNNLLGFFLLTAIVAQAATTTWNPGDGDWSQSGHWKPTQPDGKTDCNIGGKNRVRLAPGDTAIVGSLNIGLNRGESPAFTMDGGSLTITRSLRLGEYTGGSGELIVKGGVLCLQGGYVYIGAANYYEADANWCKGMLRISGGSVDCRGVFLGSGKGSEGTLEVIGSKVSHVHVWDALSMGTCGFGPHGEIEYPSTTVLSFKLDAGGVTPILIYNKDDGLRLDAGGDVNLRVLRISLLAAPPPWDVLLVGTRHDIRGRFTHQPEGAPIQARYGKRTYQWTLTYCGGPEKHDLMLRFPCEVGVDGKLTPLTSAEPGLKPPPRPALTLNDIVGAVPVLPEDNPSPGKIPAFPGAEGYGAYTPGGRGGKVLAVTNLNDSGPGSLREALESKGPRTVVFRTGGIIQLEKCIQIKEPYLTLAGQTAPGDGICIRAGKSLQGCLLLLNETHDVVIRHLRLRAGLADNQGMDCLRSEGNSENFILDHVSMSWSRDKNMVLYGDRYTVQWCVFSEALNSMNHAFAVCSNGRASFHHNLLAHNLSRTPRFGISSRCDWRNNVNYDWGHTGAYGELTWINYADNYFKPGPSTTQRPALFYRGECTVAPGSFYASGNVMDGSPELTRDNWRRIVFEPEVKALKPFACPAVKTQTAEEAYELVLAGAGAIAPHRDGVDERLVREVRAGNGKIPVHENDVGGYPAYQAGTALLDSDHDGIPDDWEKAHGLNPNDPADAGRITADGYTNLEHYLNSLVPQR